MAGASVKAVVRVASRIRVRLGLQPGLEFWLGLGGMVRWRVTPRVEFSHLRVQLGLSEALGSRDNVCPGRVVHLAPVPFGEPWVGTRVRFGECDWDSVPDKRLGLLVCSFGSADASAVA